jgi:hypothetical protein
MSLTKVSFSMITGAYVNVLDLGADASGISDSHSAFAAAWDAVKLTGGVIYIPPGNYLLNSQWVCEISSYKNIKITGFGATLFAGPLVTGHAIKIANSFNQTILDIEGLNFNHIDNTTVGGCFLLSGAHCVHITSCNVEFFDTKAGYSFALLESSVPGDGAYHCFWCSIEKCNTRTRSGDSPADYGIILDGAANATKIKENQFSALNTAIYIKTDGLVASDYGLANGVIISENDFEDISNVAVSIQGQAGYLGITGLRVLSNRIEACPTFVSFVTNNGSPCLTHATPPVLMANYGAGDTVTWLFNPTNYTFTVFESINPGYSPIIQNKFIQNGGLQLVFGNEYGLNFVNDSGNSAFDVAYYTMGAYRYWTNAGDGKFYVKAGVPTSGTDGQVVGTQT